MKTALLFLLTMVGTGCNENANPITMANDLSGNWAIAFDKDAICFGTMSLVAGPDGVSGAFSCGPIAGTVVGQAVNGHATLTLSAVYPDGRRADMPVSAAIDADDMAVHGTVGYPEQPGVAFAARRPFSF